MTKTEMAEAIYVATVAQQEYEVIDGYQLKAIAKMAWDAVEVWDESLVDREFESGR